MAFILTSISLDTNVPISRWGKYGRVKKKQHTKTTKKNSRKLDQEDNYQQFTVKAEVSI